MSDEKRGITWDDLDKLSITWDELDSLGITWGDLETMTKDELSEKVERLRNK